MNYPYSCATMPAPLPLIVAKYLESTFPTVLDPFLAQANISPSTLADARARGLPDLRTLVDEYEAWRLARRLRETSLAAAAGPPKEEGDVRELLSTPMRDVVRRTVLQRVKETYDRIGTGGFLSVKYERVAKRTFDTQTAR